MVSSVQMPVYAAESTNIEQEDGGAAEITEKENAENESKEKAEPVEASSGQDSEPAPEDADVCDPVEAVNADREDEGTADSDIESNEVGDYGVMDAGDGEIPALAEVQEAEPENVADIPAVKATTTTYQITGRPTLNTYFTGEDIDPSGVQLVMIEIAEDGSEKRTPVPIADAVLDDYDSSTEGIKTITVTYRGYSVNGDFKVLYVNPLSEKLTIEYGSTLSEISEQLPAPAES